MIGEPENIMLFHALYIVAIVAEAMTAALAAGRRSMDWVGVCLLGCVTALGGGSTRDVLSATIRSRGWNTLTILL